MCVRHAGGVSACAATGDKRAGGERSVDAWYDFLVVHCLLAGILADAHGLWRLGGVFRLCCAADVWGQWGACLLLDEPAMLAAAESCVICCCCHCRLLMLPTRLCVYAPISVCILT
jgi:hypothetical protein